MVLSIKHILVRKVSTGRCDKGGGDSDVYEHGGGWAGVTSVQSADDDDPRNFVTMAGAPFARAAFSSPPSRTTSADAVQTKASNLSAGAINLSAA